MKRIAFILLTPFLFACSGNDASTNKTETNGKLKDSDTEILSSTMNQNSKGNATIVGSYVGDFEAPDINPGRTFFYKNKINISIDAITGDEITGHSVVAGNNRPFKGIFKMEKDSYVIEASEPGDDKYDGKFSFTISPPYAKMIGTWRANNNNLEGAKRNYLLVKTEFNYNPNNTLPNNLIGNIIPEWSNITALNDEPGYEEIVTEDVLKFNSSKDKLTKEDVENMYKGDLEILRNSIYARHGYSFKNRKMRYIFDTQVDWYVPTNTDIRESLTKLEKDNIDLIKRYEEHASKYYDSFGR